MRTRLALPLCLLLLVACDAPVNPLRELTSPASPSPEPTEVEEVEESPIEIPEEPDGEAEFSHACDYVLGDFSEHTATGIRFIASVDVINTGNIGVVAKVVVRWKQLGKQPLTKSKTIKLGYGKQTTVNFTVPVSRNELDLIQSAQELGEICSANVTLIDVFGEVQS